MKVYKIRILFALLLLPFVTSAQFYVSPGSTFYAPAGTLLSFDSLTIIPDATLAMSNTTISRSYVPFAGAGGASVNRVYTINTPLNLSGTIGMYVSNAELNGNMLAALQVAYDPGTGYITTTNSIVNSAASYVSNHFSAPVILSKITAVNAGVVLPVKITNFHAVPADDKVKIDWAAASEGNTDHYIIERSVDGNSFSEILSRAAVDSDHAKYTAYDDDPATGLNYYRLLEVDMAGRKTYYGTRIVRFEGNDHHFSLLIYPNPATDIVFAELPGNIPGNAWLTVTDMNGKSVMRMSFDKKKISFSIAHLPAGIYFANYTGGQEHCSFRISKL